MVCVWTRTGCVRKTKLSFFFFNGKKNKQKYKENKSNKIFSFYFLNLCLDRFIIPVINRSIITAIIVVVITTTTIVISGYYYRCYLCYYYCCCLWLVQLNNISNHHLSPSQQHRVSRQSVGHESFHWFLPTPMSKSRFPGPILPTSSFGVGRKTMNTVVLRSSV